MLWKSKGLEKWCNCWRLLTRGKAQRPLKTLGSCPEFALKLLHLPRCYWGWGSGARTVWLKTQSASLSCPFAAVVILGRWGWGPASFPAVFYLGWEKAQWPGRCVEEGWARGSTRIGWRGCSHCQALWSVGLYWAAYLILLIDLLVRLPAFWGWNYSILSY